MEESGLGKLFDTLAKLAAVVVLLAMAFGTILDLGWLNWIEDPELIITIAEYAVTIAAYGGLIMASLVALEFGFKKGGILLILMIIIVALVVLPTFFGDLWEQIQSWITVQP